MNRLILPKLATLLIFAILVGRLYQLQLVDAEADRFRHVTRVRTTRFLPALPMRGEVFASDGKTRLAESVPIFTVSIRPADLPPAESDERAEVFAQLSQLLGISTTLTITPALALEQDSVLRSDLGQGLGLDVVAAAAQPSEAGVTLTVPPQRSLVALRLSRTYSTTLQLVNPIAAQIERADLPGYQTLTIKEGIPRDIALVLRENAVSLPGVVVGQDYRRRYPLSGEVQSLSHLLGYIGRINECELVRQNPARSWVVGLLDTISHTAACGVVSKQINPYQLGVPYYLPDDRIGKDGIEASYEERLRGELGYTAIVVDAFNRPVRVPEVVRPVRNGDNLVLTIDIGLQRQVEQILRNWIDEGERRRQTQPDVFAFKRDYLPIRSGVAIVTEVHTGRILAMASWPSYNNNIWVDPARTPELQMLLEPPSALFTETLRLAPLTNRAIAGQYPPGSTLKQFDASIALQKGVIGPDTRIHDPGRLVVQNQFNASETYTFPNAGFRNNKDITVSDALMVSSNVFFMSVAGGNKDQVINLREEQKIIERGLGIEGLAEGLSWFGLGDYTGVKLAGEKPGRVPTPKWKQEVLRQTWVTADTYNASIGQGNLEVTPLQLVMAGAAVANNGQLYRPQIVRSITGTGGQVIEEIGPELVRQVPVEPNYFSIVREGMRRSVTEGANKAARDECSGLQIAGKTGTAEFGPLIDLPPLNGKPRDPVRQSHSWFVGFAPYDNPQIEVLVLVEGTGDLGDGSATIAVPAVTQIMQSYFNVTPPNPLPSTCQQDLPPLPSNITPAPTVVAVEP
jgi:penicillin-binding protein 2